MSFRENLGKHPGMVIAALLALITCAGWYSMRAMRPEAAPVPTRYYFTADDGKTTFADGYDRLPPFQYDGREAVRAHVFSADGGATKVVTILEKLSPDYRAKVEAAMKTGPTSPGVLPTVGVPAFGTLVKRPGDQAWYPIASPQGGRLAGLRGPPGARQSYVEIFPD